MVESLPVVAILFDLPVSMLLGEPADKHERKDESEQSLHNVGIDGSWG